MTEKSLPTAFPTRQHHAPDIVNGFQFDLPSLDRPKREGRLEITYDALRKPPL